MSEPKRIVPADVVAQIHTAADRADELERQLNDEIKRTGDLEAALALVASELKHRRRPDLAKLASYIDTVLGRLAVK